MIHSSVFLKLEAKKSRFLPGGAGTHQAILDSSESGFHRYLQALDSVPARLGKRPRHGLGDAVGINRAATQFVFSRGGPLGGGGPSAEGVPQRPFAGLFGGGIELYGLQLCGSQFLDRLLQVITFRKDTAFFSASFISASNVRAVPLAFNMGRPILALLSGLAMTNNLPFSFSLSLPCPAPASFFLPSRNSSACSP